MQNTAKYWKLLQDTANTKQYRKVLKNIAKNKNMLNTD
jgi:hypothetical protein